MRPETRILVGLALIGAGGAALVGMNIWTVRPWCAQSTAPAVSGQRSSVPVTTHVHPASSANEVREVVPDAGHFAARAREAGIGDAGQAETSVHDAAATQSEGSAEAAVEQEGIPEIRFPKGSSVPSKEMVSVVKLLSTRLGENFRMKVTLTGHGDDPKDPDAYIRLGRRRASAILRMLVDYRVSMSRIAVAFPPVEHGHVVTGGVAPGSVQVRIEPRFLKKERDKHAP